MQCVNETDPSEPKAFDPSELDLDLPPPPDAAPLETVSSAPAPLEPVSAPPAPLESAPAAAPSIGSSAVRSASRELPLPAEPRPPLGKAVLQERLIDTVLNMGASLSELVEDFRSSDRFFKYKFAVLVVWGVLFTSSLTVACGQRGPTNDIHAVLVRAGDAAHPIYLVKNDSSAPWQDVEVLVNGAYRATSASLEANGGSITLSPAVLYDEAGNPAPSGLQVTDIVVSVIDPSETVTLLRSGEPVK
jgi:hypothetical protein